MNKEAVALRKKLESAEDYAHSLKKKLLATEKELKQLKEFLKLYTEKLDRDRIQRRGIFKEKP